MSSCGSVETPCLIDSQVNTLIESYFKKYFVSRGPTLFNLVAANRLVIPYIGYIEVDLNICGESHTKKGSVDC